ncbi:MAG: protein kinase [Polyangiaceae bacterium]|nr:protein kinase [Polyangiaceae bacterium]
MESPTTLRPGDWIEDRYQLLRLLGSGGFGQVFEARHRYLARPTAIKAMHVHHVGRAELRQRMQVEALVLSRLDHPNVIRVHDAGVLESGVVWLAMDLLEGQTLRELLTQVGHLEVPTALDYALQIAEGIEAAHQLNVIHRDLKPENVFVTKKGELKVLDLGMAKLLGYNLKTTEVHELAGTVPYMSPEHLSGKQVDPRSDVYGLGLVLFEIISGRHPFIAPGEEPNHVTIGHRQLNSPPPSLLELVPGLPPYVWDIVEKALSKSRAGRQQTMQELASELRSARQRLEGIAERKQSPGRARIKIELPDTGLAVPGTEPRDDGATIPQSVAPWQSETASPRMNTMGAPTPLTNALVGHAPSQLAIPLPSVQPTEVAPIKFTQPLLDAPPPPNPQGNIHQLATGPAHGIGHTVPLMDVGLGVRDEAAAPRSNDPTRRDLPKPRDLTPALPPQVQAALERQARAQVTLKTLESPQHAGPMNNGAAQSSSVPGYTQPTLESPTYGSPAKSQKVDVEVRDLPPPASEASSSSRRGFRLSPAVLGLVFLSLACLLVFIGMLMSKLGQ